MGDETVDELAGKATVWEAVGGGPYGFFNSTDRVFDDVDVLVGGANVKVNGAREEGEIVGEVEVEEVVAEASEFVVGVEGLDRETAAGIEEDFGFDSIEDGAFGAVRGGHGGAVADFVGDEMEEGKALDVEEIDAEGDGGMMLLDEGGKRGGGEGGRMGGRRALGLFTFEEGDVGAVDEGGALDVGGGDGGIADEAVGDIGHEFGRGRAADETVKGASGVSAGEFGAAEQGAVGGHGLEAGRSRG